MSDFEFSDSEPDEVTWENASCWQLNLGKYRGQTLGAMVRKREQREYLRWLVTWDQLRQETKVYVTCALDHYQHVKQSRTPG